MKIRFWGVRGSIPTPLRPEEVRAKIRDVLVAGIEKNLKTPADVDAFMRTLPMSQKSTYGGNTSCVEVRCGETQIIFDAGSGLRELGVSPLGKRGKGGTHLFLSHTHWDHICGLPFFIEAYVPNNSIYIYSPKREIKAHLANQHLEPNFPVTFSTLAGIRDFRHVPMQKPYRFEECTVTPFPLDHPGEAFGYRLEHNGKVVLYATDSEFRNVTSKDLVDYNPYANADMLIFDAMYTFEDGIKRMDWGHGVAEIGVDICVRHNIKSLCVYHHEPTYNDAKLEYVLARVREYRDTTYPDSKLEVFLAQEGLEIDL